MPSNLKSDVELGATEQKFNLLVHREIQREYGLPGQAVLTMPILVGLDGSRKMSKSLGNYVGITEPPVEMFGKLMSIPDELMWQYYELITDRTPAEITALKSEVADGKLHPMDAKMRLATEVIATFHGQDAANKAAENFQRVFRDRQAPTEIPVVKMTPRRSQATQRIAGRTQTGRLEKRSRPPDQTRRRRSRRRPRRRSAKDHANRQTRRIQSPCRQKEISATGAAGTSDRTATGSSW